MQSCCFFFSRPFHESFDFLKNCPYDSNEIFYSHSTLYYGPLCAISLNSYGWDVRNIAKINQKWPKNRHSLIFSKIVHTIQTKISTVIFYTIEWSYVWNFNKFVRFWDWSESEGKRPKPTPLSHMRLWFKVVCQICASFREMVKVCSKLVELQEIATHCAEMSSPTLVLTHSDSTNKDVFNQICLYMTFASKQNY